MPVSRRRFLAASTAAGLGAGLAVGRADHASAVSERAPQPAPAPKRLLILGGTGFIGPPMVDYARARGHTVTLFNRGRTNTHLFPDIEKLVGDRDGDLRALEGRSWDVVLDNHATRPSWVRATARLLSDSVQHYVFVSTLSVYDVAAFGARRSGAAGRDEAARIDESAPVLSLPAGFGGEAEASGRAYGPLKARAEDEAHAAFPGRATIVRPGLIVGPGDPTDRFTYWPVRIARGGEILVPSDGRDSVQFIDVRDLTSWLVRLAEAGDRGTFNATGPESRLSMAEMVHGMRAVTTGPVRFTWVDRAFLTAHGARPWSDLPVWMGSSPVTYVRIDRAVDRGLTFRPLADTTRDTLDWHAARPEAERATLGAGLTPDREAELLRSWHARSAE